LAAKPEKVAGRRGWPRGKRRLPWRAVPRLHRAWDRWGSKIKT